MIPDSVRFRLAGEVVPPFRLAHQVAERARRATLGRARSLYGADGVPVCLSGHTGGIRATAHRHAFWLPEDADGDGRIDHLTVHAPALDAAALAALLAADIAIHSRRERWRGHWHWIGRHDDPEAPSALFALAAEWLTITPYYQPWHAKRGFAQDDMIRRECAARGLPPLLAVDLIGSGAELPRWRWRESAPPASARGTAWRLVFAAPVRGPLALGYGCHFGLGQFGPACGVP